MRLPSPLGAIRPLLLVGLVGAFLTAAHLAGCGRSEGPPGLILVTIDTCRADRLGCYGARDGATPVLDALAARGVLLEQVQAPVPLTLPSHCSLLTGLYPDRHTVRNNGTARLPDAAVTLPEILRDRGWRTAAFLSAFPLDRQFGVDQGFEIYDDELSGSSAGSVATEEGRRADVADGFFYDERTAAATAASALPWIEEASRGEDPFFAWIHFFDPHSVYEPPARFLTERRLDAYGGEIAYVDEQLGRILEALGEREESTTLIVTADHGESLGEHGEVSHGLFVYESSLRVPWLMAGPGLPAGRRIGTPVSLVQVLPTALDLLGLPLPEGLDGASTLPLLREGEPEAVPIHGESLFGRTQYDWAGLRTVRRGRWKLIEAPRPELYDLESDPHEEHDLAAARPELVAELREEMRRHAGRGGRLDADHLSVSEETRRRLEALGYVGGAGAEILEEDADLWSLGGRDPKDMVGFFNRLQEIPTLLFSGRAEAAERLLKELRVEDPQNLDVLHKLALVCRMEERWEEAGDYCRAVLDLDPDDVRARRNRAHALRMQGDREGARLEYRELLERHPEEASGWAALGALDSQDGLSEDAARAFRRAAELEPDVGDHHYALGRALEAAGRIEEALRSYERTRALEPARTEAVNAKALLLASVGRTREAVTALRSAVERHPDDVDSRNNLAWILTNGSIDAEEGYTHARRAAELAPDDPVILDTLGWAAIRSGRPREAIAPLERAWRATGDAEVRAHLGVALAESGREPEGIEHVRAALAERPDLTRLPEVSRWSRRR
jgi:arylsulfatase A-like enzyme/Flp pilus assembly protein TadD